ncbi:MAG TPA: Chromate resistance protein ChrB [Acidimicrobiales bacterium]|nr:Chromate resistance protein ChrB [Acidimicrobiales bacterium]
MDWILLVYRVPIEPSRHRVAVWRHLRRVGAVSLQGSIAGLPASDDNLAALRRAAEIVEGAGGEFFLLGAEALDDVTRQRLEALYTESVEAEYRELLSECAKFRAEIRKEIRIRKFTEAELAEEEASFERLERWVATLAGKDAFGAPSRPEAERVLKECAAALDGYAAKVYVANER